MQLSNRSQRFALFVCVSCLQSASAFADVAPPPPPTLPQIPGTPIPLPSAILIVVAGILLSIGVVWIGSMISRKNSRPSALGIAACAAMGVACATIVGVIFAQQSHADYQQRRNRHQDELRNWRPGEGPPQPGPMMPPGDAIDGANDGAGSPPASEDPEPTETVAAPE